MAVTGWKYAGTAATVDNGTSVDWSNPDYAKADDTSYASCAVPKNGASDLLTLSNFGFSSSDIPSGSTIDGIEFVMSRYAGTDFMTENALYLRKASGRTGSNMASTTYWAISSPTEKTYGGATEMCGTTLTQSDIVASTFGIELAITQNTTYYVDYIKIRVYYTEGGGSSVKPYYYYLNQ